MGIMKRGNLAKYWNKCAITQIPFFGKYLSRNSYQLLLANFHAASDTINPAKGQPGHDPLHKIRPLVDMCKQNFQLIYRPGRCILLDEGSCPFKGRNSWICYNKDKPNKWAFKIFEVCDAKNGFICGFDIYCGKGMTECAVDAPVTDNTCTVTTKTVIGLLDSMQLLNKHHFVYLETIGTIPMN